MGFLEYQYRLQSLPVVESMCAPVFQVLYPLQGTATGCILYEYFYDVRVPVLKGFLNKPVYKEDRQTGFRQENKIWWGLSSQQSANWVTHVTLTLELRPHHFRENVVKFNFYEEQNLILHNILAENEIYFFVRKYENELFLLNSTVHITIRYHNRPCQL